MYSCPSVNGLMPCIQVHMLKLPMQEWLGSVLSFKDPSQQAGQTLTMKRHNTFITALQCTEETTATVPDHLLLSEKHTPYHLAAWTLTTEKRICFYTEIQMNTHSKTTQENILLPRPPQHSKWILDALQAFNTQHHNSPRQSTTSPFNFQTVNIKWIL